MKKILIIGKVWPEAKSSAAGTRMMQLIHFFFRQKCEVVFASTAKKSGFEEDLEKLGVETHSILLNDASFDTFLQHIKPSHVVYDRFMTEEQFGWRVRKYLPDAFEILNTEDLHFLRDARKTAFQKSKQIDISQIRTETLFRELASIMRCDKTLLVSKVEKELLEKHYQVSPTQLIYYPVLIDQVMHPTPSFEERVDLLFIGNFFHAPNWDALLYLKQDIWPELRKQLPKAKLHIYGAYASEKVRNLNNEKENFIVHGRVEDALLVTKKIRLSLSPLRFGAGIKGKILEALACCTPFVTTEIGAEAMLDKQFDFCVSKSTSDFIKKSVQLYNDKQSWIKAQELGCKLAENKFNYLDFEESLKIEMLNSKKNKNKSIVEQLLDFHGNKHYTYFSKWIANKS